MNVMARVILFVATIVGWTLLTYLTSLVTRLASWVVYNDEVWSKMNADGLAMEHVLFEVLHALKGVPFTIVVAVAGLVFLWFLFRTFFRSKSPEAAI